MRLKQLEIYGFKSFADRTNFTFLPGVTAIVGPNGSGKSNIADALRWVMGEHNIRNLRGVRLDDIIFSGSESRKPLGMAEVTLVMDNSDGYLPLDFAEIAVTRRIYRSGESEFLINRTPVRLKDIQDLFSDTGLGKESYSIIGQGKIDAILSLRPEERRMIFEEAAGITKYKNQKATALRKLVETENNLLRIQDVLEELKSQAEPLAVRAETARLYLQISEELATLEINHFYNELEKIRLELEDLAAREEESTGVINDLAAEEGNLERRITELRLLLEKLENEKNNTQDLLRAHGAEKERAVGKLHLFAERRRFHQEKLEELTGLLQEQERKLSQLKERKEALAVQVESGDEEKARINQAVREKEEELRRKEERILEIRRRLEEKKNRLSLLLQDLTRMKQEINTIEVHNGFRREKIEEYRESLENLTVELTDYTEKKKLIQVKLIEAEQRKTALEEEEKNLRAEQAKTQNYLEAQVKKNQELRDKIRAVESRITILSEMEREHQGYNQGVKSLLRAQKEPFHREIRGVVADLMKVEKGYELALEVALGRALQFLVINTEAAARRAIEYLKRYSLGRVTFLPLDLVESGANRLEAFAGLLRQYNCQPATAVIRYNPAYQTVFKHLLGTVIIAPEMETAVLIAEKTGKRFRIVTPDGEVIAPGGIITGGKFRQQPAGLLMRKRQLAELAAEKKDLLAFLNRSLTEEKKLREKTAMVNAGLEEKISLLQETIMQTNFLQKDGETLEKTCAQMREEQARIEKVVGGLTEEISAQTQAIKEKEAILKKLEADIERENCELRELEETEKGLLKDKEAGLKEYSELTARLAGIQQEWAGKSESLWELENSIRELAAAREEKEQELARIKGELLKEDQEQVALEIKTKQDEEEEKRLTAKLEAIRAEWQVVAAELAEKEGELRELGKRRGEITAGSHRLELQLNKLRLQEENLRGYLLENYGEYWTCRVQEDWNEPPGVKRRIAGLKKEIKEMGPVDPQAIEDYEKITERIDFLSTQHEDLTVARGKLEQVVEEIEKKIKVRFLETFNQVREAFIHLFAELFSGGRADLKLLDPDDPLESGIEILAQPPGKRLQILSLLSGGERAMTAVALLFAVLRVKPSPFCILDEIDATLDHTNIRRFVELLKLFSKETQFIMITHRRDTMEVAEALYGVAMEEKGVSKLISLELKQQAG
ncbi:MAG: chromosome segregation protein SMC [Firmicutes bacterium]|nr:chromosome segregation protein SMC [Bacillota bacterium]